MTNCNRTNCYLVQVNQDTRYRVQEAGQLVIAVVLLVRLSQVHLFTPLDQLCVHQVHVLWANFLAWLQRKINNTVHEQQWELKDYI